DQLGCGKSARPRGTARYTIAHNVEEVEGVRKALQLGKVHLMGSSYGGALAIATALKYQRNLRSLVITGGLASVPLTVREMRRLVNRLPPKTRATLVTVGRYDEVTPRVAESIHRGIRGSKLVRFENSAHLAMWEERSHYIGVVRDFLDRVRSK